MALVQAGFLGHDEASAAVISPGIHTTSTAAPGKADAKWMSRPQHQPILFYCMSIICEAKSTMAGFEKAKKNQCWG